MAGSGGAATMDWNDLASSNLPTLAGSTRTPGRTTLGTTPGMAATAGGGGGVAAANNNTSTATTTGDLNRNLSMLQVAGQSLLSASSGRSAAAAVGGMTMFGTTTAAGAGVPPQSLFPSSAGGGGPSNGSFAAQQQQQQQQQQHAQPAPSATLESLDDALHRHQQSVLRDLVQESRETTRRATEHAVEAQLQAAWEMDRAAWLERHHPSWMAAAASIGIGTATSNMDGGGRYLGQQPQQQQQQRQQQLLQQSQYRTAATTPRGLLAPPPGAVIRDEAAGSLPSHSNYYGTSSESNLGAALVQSHLSIVQNMFQHTTTTTAATTTTTTASLNDAVEQFLLCLEGRHHDPAALGYAAAWRLAGQLVSMPQPSSPVDRAVAALAHFGQQYRAHVLRTVRQSAATAASSGSNSSSSSNYENDLTAQCQAYATLQLGTTATSNCWAAAYFCLRCGDAAAALEAVTNTSTNDASNNNSNSVDPAVARLLSAVARVQGPAPSLWEGRDGHAAVSAALHLDAADQQTVADRLENCQRRERAASGNIGGGSSSSNSSIHEMGVYAFLSAAAASSSEQPVVRSDSVEGFCRMEDYLMAALWRAVLRPSPVDELVRLAHRIAHEWGPAALDDPTAGGWSYATPLLAAQQYETALQWVARSRRGTGVLQAAHLALVLSQAGIPVTNLGGSSSSSHRSIANSAHDGSRSSSLKSRHTDTADGAVVASLLVAYATELLSHPQGGSVAALTYLLRIPNAARARKEVAKLIASTGDIHELAGRLTPEGMRLGGALAEHVASPAELTLILVEAADILAASGAPDDRQKTETAGLCLMLAGRYGDVLALLNEHLSPADRPSDPDRSHWVKHSHDFQTNYLQKRTHVLDVLERENQQSIVQTNRLLLDLNHFFDRTVRERQHDATAWAAAEKLDLLPVSAADRQAKEARYQALDPLVQQVYPALLVQALTILQQEHGRLKRTLHTATVSDGGVVRQRLHELEATAQVYTSFAASIGIASARTGELTHLASLMI